MQGLHQSKKGFSLLEKTKHGRACVRAFLVGMAFSVDHVCPLACLPVYASLLDFFYHCDNFL